LSESFEENSRFRWSGSGMFSKCSLTSSSSVPAEWKHNFQQN
jgi:hypothetical protein